MSSHYLASSSTGLDFFLHQASKKKPLNNKQEQALAVRCVSGDRAAMDTLVEHNILFVVTQIDKFVNHSFTAEDLIQEGIMGLYAAAEKFQPVGVRFCSYAVWWIRAACQKYTTYDGSLVKRSNNVRQATDRVRRFRSQGGNPQAGVDEIRPYMNKEKTKFTDFQIQAAIENTMPVKSLNMPLSRSSTKDLDASTHLDMLADPRDVRAEEDIKTMRRVIDKALKDLPESERYCIQRYFLDEKSMNTSPLGERGTYHENATTLKEVGKEFGVTREAIRQRVSRGLKKLNRKHGDILRKALEELA